MSEGGPIRLTPLRRKPVVLPSSGPSCRISACQRSRSAKSSTAIVLGRETTSQKGWFGRRCRLQIVLCNTRSIRCLFLMGTAFSGDDFWEVVAQMSILSDRVHRSVSLPSLLAYLLTACLYTTLGMVSVMTHKWYFSYNCPHKGVMSTVLAT